MATLDEVGYARSLVNSLIAAGVRPAVIQILERGLLVTEAELVRDHPLDPTEIELIQKGERIEAIKHVRQRYNCGLLIAKMITEQLR